MSVEDPFPQEKFGALIRRLPRYARLAWHLSRHPKVTRKRRAALLAGIAYLISPIDLVPGIIPVVGQLDDAAAVLIGLSVALRSLSASDRAAALLSANLSADDIDTDLHAIGAIYAWIARAGVRTVRRYGSAGVSRISGMVRSVLR